MTHVASTEKIVIKIAAARVSIVVAEIAAASRECCRITVCGGDIAAVMSSVRAVWSDIAAVMSSVHAI